MIYMIIMGIESSAHTIGVGVVEDRKILSNKRKMYPISNKGIIPSKVAEFHSKHIPSLIRDALAESKINIEDIDAVAYTKGPGIGACLRIGQIAAKTISRQFDKPIFPVNHSVAHIEIARVMFNMHDPLVLYVSGGNSQILGIINKPFRHYHVYGETLDIGIGNALDNFARSANLLPAWGSSVAKVAEGGKYIAMPYNVKGMDFTFTGLLKYATDLLAKEKLPDIAYSFQETMFSMLCEATERALFLLGKKELILCGGVAQNKRLNEMLQSIADSHGVKFGVAPDQFNADNGAMIAVVGLEMLENKDHYTLSEATIDQKFRADKFEIKWQL